MLFWLSVSTVSFWQINGCSLTIDYFCYYSLLFVSYELMAAGLRLDIGILFCDYYIPLVFLEIMVARLRLAMFVTTISC